MTKKPASPSKTEPKAPGVPAAAATLHRVESLMKTVLHLTTNLPPLGRGCRFWMSLISTEWEINASPKYLSAMWAEQQLCYASLKAF